MKVTRLRNDRLLATSTITMRTAVSLTLAFVLVTFLAICPSMACPLNAGQRAGGCCHKSQQGHNSCPRPVVDCPYLILERGKTALTVPTAVAPPKSVLPYIEPADLPTVIAATSRVPDSAGLFLRIRVLLI